MKLIVKAETGVFLARATGIKVKGFQIMAALCLMLCYGTLQADNPTGPSKSAQTVPAPVFQSSKLASPYADGSAEAQGFVNFFNDTYLTGNNPTLPTLTKQEVVWFPPQTFGDTSLEDVHKGTAAQSKMCNDPEGYPIVCENDFGTSTACQACHDSALFVTGGGLPEMSYYSEDHDWLANWSQYGEWSASIMRLATRDPIWQAQIETETNTSPNVDPRVIQDVCFSCHGAMGERQLKADFISEATSLNPAVTDDHFCTDIFYATIPGLLPSAHRGEEFPFSEYCAPVGGKTVGEAPDLYAKYGSLARDGVSCEVCHRMGPTPDDPTWTAPGKWDGEDFTPFYGPKHINKVQLKQTENPMPLEHDFTANFEYFMGDIMAPDPVGTLLTEPMAAADLLGLSQALDTKNDVSYLRQSVMCGACHVLIVPQIPTAYDPDMPVPESGSMKLGDGDYPFYERPESCTAESPTFAPAPSKWGGNPVTDDCVAVGYEQATYLEWINSEFATEQDTDTTCQGCHMPLITDPDNPSNHNAILSQLVEGTDGITSKQFRRHRMMGINLPVFEMFAQFPQVLGVNIYDDLLPNSGTDKDGTTTPFIQHNLLNGEMTIVEQATAQANGTGLTADYSAPDPQASAEISIDSLKMKGSTLSADLTVTNNTGHKFPSGAGFRRAFIRFEVLDDTGGTIWISGDTNPYGAICDGECVQSGNTWNLLESETNPTADPTLLQPHYATVSQPNQVQIYEIQDVDDTGTLTSRTLALFHSAKDNRLLPRGFASAKTLKCGKSNQSTASIFGVPLCSAAYATEPQLMPLTKNSAIAKDQHYIKQDLAGSDQISYSIPNMQAAASIRVTMQYQTIPPGYLAARFKQGHTADGYLPATERAIYLTSHLNTNLDLHSENPDNPDLLLSKNWTMSLHQASASVGGNSGNSGD